MKSRVVKIIKIECRMVVIVVVRARCEKYLHKNIGFE